MRPVDFVVRSMSVIVVVILKTLRRRVFVKWLRGSKPSPTLSLADAAFRPSSQRYYYAVVP